MSACPRVEQGCGVQKVFGKGKGKTQGGCCVVMYGSGEREPPGIRVGMAKELDAEDGDRQWRSIGLQKDALGWIKTEEKKGSESR